uniref:G protein-coupled receptor n=1 Tax=Acrobeloides nanus TaxID=290746 RepID=A0A914EBZ8_9BILA
MGIYKLLLLNQLLWAYLFDVVLAVWQPVILFPFFICYSAGVAKVFGPMSVYPMYTLMAAVYVPTIVWLFTPDTGVEIVRKNIISTEPIMEKVVELEPTTNGFDWDSGRVILIVGFFDYGLIFIILIPFILSCSVIFVRRMKQLRSTTNLQTFRLQIMLFKTLVVQTVLVLLTVAMPVV